MIKLAIHGFWACSLLCSVFLCISLIAGCNENLNFEALPDKTDGGNIVALYIDFQEGFLDDTVVLKVNNEEVFNKKHVSTSPLLGLAESLTTDIESGYIIIEVNVPTKGIGQTMVLEIMADIYMGISIINDVIRYEVKKEPFGYM